MTPRHPEIVALWRDGASAGQIAKRMNLTRNQVVGRLNRMGLLGHKPKKTPYVKKHLRVPGCTIRGLSWDERLFAPYAIWKAEKKMERENALR